MAPAPASVPASSSPVVDEHSGPQAVKWTSTRDLCFGGRSCDCHPPRVLTQAHTTIQHWEHLHLHRDGRPHGSITTLEVFFGGGEARVRESGCGDHHGLQEATTPAMEEDKVHCVRIEVLL